ncbi:hypothetical protein QQ045_001851 [Rhodiola kirilowii]
MPTLSATDSGSGATFSATFFSFNQPFEDPFGDTPFRATPSTDSNPAQPENPPSFHPTMNQGFPLSSSPVASQGQKEPDSQNYNEGFIQHSVSSVPVASHMVSQLNDHHNSGGFIQQQGVPQLAPRVQNYQNPQSFNDELFQQQHTYTATEGPHMAPEFSYSSTAQQIGGGFSQQPGSSQRNPNSNSQQPGSPQIAHQGQTEQNPHQSCLHLYPLGLPTRVLDLHMNKMLRRILVVFLNSQLLH